MDDLKVRKRIRRVVAHHRDGARLFATTVAACAKPVQVSRTALELWATGYQQGEIDADQVVSQAQDAAKRVDYAEPHDPSLRQAQTLLGAMFNEYAKAFLAEEKGKQAGDKMYRAYGLANF